MLTLTFNFQVLYLNQVPQSLLTAPISSFPSQPLLQPVNTCTCVRHTHTQFSAGWSCPPGDRCSVWRRSGHCDLWGEVVTRAVTLSWTLWVLNSTPARPSSMPGASPVMTTRDVPWGQNHPGRGLCCRWLCFCREGVHSFTKGLMEACMYHTGEHQLMRDTNYPQREKHGSGETR